MQQPGKAENFPRLTTSEISGIPMFTASRKGAEKVLTIQLIRLIRVTGLTRLPRFAVSAAATTATRNVKTVGRRPRIPYSSITSYDVSRRVRCTPGTEAVRDHVGNNYGRSGIHSRLHSVAACGFADLLCAAARNSGDYSRGARGSIIPRATGPALGLVSRYRLARRRPRRQHGSGSGVAEYGGPLRSWRPLEPGAALAGSLAAPARTAGATA